MIRTLSAAAALFTATQLSAQLPMVDIGLADNGAGGLEVRLRPDGDFDQFFSSIVFTIRWDAASGANLDTIAQVPPVSSYMPMMKSGPEQDAGGYRYQIFAGFSMVTLNNLGASWTGGDEVTLMTIPVVNGSSVFEVVNDSWTGDINNNGDYYVSLNGEDKTGVIYEISTGVTAPAAEGPSLAVHPNPATAQTVLDLYVPTAAATVTAEWTDATGRIVRRDRIADRGRMRLPVDVSRMARGTYVLCVRADGAVLTEQVVLH